MWHHNGLIGWLFYLVLGSADHLSAQKRNYEKYPPIAGLWNADCEVGVAESGVSVYNMRAGYSSYCTFNVRNNHFSDLVRKSSSAIHDNFAINSYLLTFNKILNQSTNNFVILEDNLFESTPINNLHILIVVGFKEHI